MTNDMLKIKALSRARTNEEAAAIINRTDDDAPKLSPPLATACLAQSILTGDVTTLRKCFENGADPNAIIAGDDNPLFFRAVSTGNIEMVNAFLAAGANLMMMDSNNGFSAMNAAVMSRDKGMVLFIIAKMLEEGADYYCLLQEALFTAVYNDDADMADYFLGAGADANGDTWFGRRFYPPLLEAVRQRNKPIAELLMDYGAVKGMDYVETKALMAGIDY